MGPKTLLLKKMEKQESKMVFEEKRNEA